MARAHGKIILAGEHAVVYGYPAVAATIPQSITIEAFESQTPGFSFPPLFERGIGQILIERLEAMLGPRVAQLEFTVNSEVSGGCGLGSSAALSVGLIRAILDRFGESRTPVEIAKMALELEKIFHGNPSGVDHTVIAKEGMIWFQKGEAQRISCPVRLSMVVVVSKPHGGTLKAVQTVRDQYEAHPQKTTRIFDAIGAITHSMRVAIQEGNLETIGQLMNQNHHLLSELGVSTPELNNLCQLALENGALGAKLTGAGGGGAIIALCHQENNLVPIFHERGFQSFGFEI